MELESEWLSKQSTSGDAKALSSLMRQVMLDINSRRMCTLTGQFTLFYIDGYNEYYANRHVIGIGDRIVFIGAIDIILIFLLLVRLFNVRIYG
jgi:hypothetical protein